MGYAFELKAVVLAVPTAYKTGTVVEYIGSVPRLDVSFSGKTIEEAKKKAAAAVKFFVESGFPDYEQNRLEAASLEERLRSANGTAISHGSVGILCGRHPPYIPSSQVKVTFYQFTQTGLARED